MALTDPVAKTPRFPRGSNPIRPAFAEATARQAMKSGAGRVAGDGEKLQNVQAANCCYSRAVKAGQGQSRLSERRRREVWETMEKV
jgi:hypothetical protein